MNVTEFETAPVAQHWAVSYAADAGAQGVFARGNMEMLNARPIVAVVGARACTAYGSHVAAQIAESATRAGLHVVTGGAYGIDAAATRTVLAAGGKPIVWQAGGLDRPYPASHNELLARVLDAGGLLLSLEPDGVAPTRQRFHDRSLAIGAFADATVVVEAGARSGSLNIAHGAFERGRQVFAVPGPITSAASAGSNGLLADPRVKPLLSPDSIALLA